MEELAVESGGPIPNQVPLMKERPQFSYHSHPLRRQQQPFWPSCCPFASVCRQLPLLRCENEKQHALVCDFQTLG